MSKSQSYLFIILPIILLLKSIECQNIDEFKKNLMSVKNFNVLSEIEGILFGNWSQNEQCTNELNAIGNGLKNSEEWAFKSK